MSLGIGASLTVGIRQGWASRVLDGVLLAWTAFVTALTAAVLLVPQVADALNLSRYSGICSPLLSRSVRSSRRSSPRGNFEGMGRVKAGAAARIGMGVVQSGTLLVMLLLRRSRRCPAGLVRYCRNVGRRRRCMGGDASSCVVKPPMDTVKRVLSLGLRTQPVWILLLLNYRLDMVILGSIAGTAAVGVYAVAVSFSEVAWFGVNALTSVLLPHLSAESDEIQLRRVATASRLSIVGTFLTAVVLVAVLAAVSQPLFGRGFSGVPFGVPRPQHWACDVLPVQDPHDLLRGGR